MDPHSVVGNVEISLEIQINISEQKQTSAGCRFLRLEAL